MIPSSHQIGEDNVYLSLYGQKMLEFLSRVKDFHVIQSVSASFSFYLLDSLRVFLARLACQSRAHVIPMASQRQRQQQRQ